MAFASAARFEVFILMPLLVTVGVAAPAARLSEATVTPAPKPEKRKRGRPRKTPVNTKPAERAAIKPVRRSGRLTK